MNSGNLNGNEIVFCVEDVVKLTYFEVATVFVSVSVPSVVQIVVFKIIEHPNRFLPLSKVTSKSSRSRSFEQKVQQIS